MFWWLRSICLSIVSIFFLLWGIRELFHAYALRHPGEFLASFFSSSFIILISAALLVGFIWRMVLRYKKIKADRALISR